MTSTLHSVSYAGLWGQDYLDLCSFIRKSAHLGYSAVELMAKRPHLSVLDATDEWLGEIRETASQCGVEIATIAGYTNFTGGKSAPEVPHVEIQVAHVRELSRIAKTLGARIVRIMTGYTTDPEASQGDWETCVKAIRECAAVAGDEGVMLGLQNHHDVASSSEGFLAFLEDVSHPNCKAMFDPWAPALHGEDLKACAKALAPLMVQTTLADYVRLRRFAYMPGLVNFRSMPDMVRAVPLGKGFVDFQAFFAGLAEGGFSGYVAYEMCSPLRGGGSVANLDQTAGTSLKVLHGLITSG